MPGKLIIHAPKNMDNLKLEVYFNGKHKGSISKRKAETYVIQAPTKVQVSAGWFEKTEPIDVSADGETEFYVTTEMFNSWKCTVHTDGPPRGISKNTGGCVMLLLPAVFVICFIIGIVSLNINPDYKDYLGAYGRGELVVYRNTFGHVMRDIGLYGGIGYFILSKLLR